MRSHDFFRRHDEEESLSNIKEEVLEAEFEFGGDDKNGLGIGCSQATKCCGSPLELSRLAMTWNFSPLAIR